MNQKNTPAQNKLRITAAKVRKQNPDTSRLFMNLDEAKKSQTQPLTRYVE